MLWCLVNELFDILDILVGSCVNYTLNSFFLRKYFFSKNDAVILHFVCLKNATS